MGSAWKANKAYDNTEVGSYDENSYLAVAVQRLPDVTFTHDEQWNGVVVNSLTCS